MTAVWIVLVIASRKGDVLEPDIYLFTNQEAARKCLTYLKEEDNKYGITEGIAEPEEAKYWEVEEDDDCYDAYCDSCSSYLTIRCYKSNVRDIFNPEE